MKMRFGSVVSVLAVSSHLLHGAPLGTAFTYQGSLADNGQPAQGLFDFRFCVFDAPSGGSPLAGPITNIAVQVNNGLFTTELDFGPGVFTGQARWLEIAVRTNGASVFVTLSPRQLLSPVPYALFAPEAGAALSATVAGSAASVPASGVVGVLGLTQLPSVLITNTQAGVNLSGSFSGNGAGLTNIPWSALPAVPLTNGQAGVNLQGLSTLADLSVTATARVNHLIVTNPPALDGSNISNLNASALASGTVPAQRLPAQVSLLGQSIEGNEITDGTITDADIAPDAAIADSKLGPIVTPGKVANSATTATAENIPDTIVLRDATGRFAAGVIHGERFVGDGSELRMLNASALAFGLVPDERLSPRVSLLGQSIESHEIADGTIVNADIAPAAGIADSKLATISTPGKVANSATTATAQNTPNAIVARDSAGNFAAGTITAIFSGNGAGLISLNASALASGTVPDERLSTNIARLNLPATFGSTVTAPTLQAATIIADYPSTNNGGITPGLIIGGSGSGEAIISKRTAGGNQYGLDFFTAFSSRMAIASNGAIRFGPGTYFSSYGDAQSSVYVLRGTSSGTTYGELFMPGGQRLVIPNNSTWTFRILVAGRASNGKAAGYCFRGFVENENGTVRMIEAVNTEDVAEDDSTWDASVSADDYYDALVITARANTGDTARWTAVVYTSEVRW